MNAPELAAIQNGHLGKIISKAVDKNETKPFLREGVFSKTMIGFDLQHGVFWVSIFVLHHLYKLESIDYCR